LEWPVGLAGVDPLWLFPGTVESGVVVVLATSPEINAWPLGVPSPVAVFAPLEVELGGVVELVLELPRDRAKNENPKPPKLHEPPKGPRPPK
jgi:hypothetical protein